MGFDRKGAPHYSAETEECEGFITPCLYRLSSMLACTGVHTVNPNSETPIKLAGATISIRLRDITSQRAPLEFKYFNDGIAFNNSANIESV
jgi:hypothetical protein